MTQPMGRYGTVYSMSKLKETQTDSRTIKSGHLDVGQGHKVYYEQWGNKKAKTPILFFHGGPGSNYKWRHKRLFDPDVHQVIFFDQRGAGNSLPYGKLEHNTTDHLIEDAAKILKHLGVKHVYAYGVSWGSTMATLFTIRRPKQVRATIVGAIFSGSQTEIDYIDKGYFGRYYPEVWERFVASVPKSFADSPASYHYEQLKKGSPKDIVDSAKALEDLELPLLMFDWPGYEHSNTIRDKEPGDKEEYDYVPYQIYSHYLSQGCFMPDKHVLTKASGIKTPFAIVQGRYDMVCPPAAAYELHKAIPKSKLYITLDSHGSSDHENRTVTRTLIDAMFV